MSLAERFAVTLVSVAIVLAAFVTANRVFAVSAPIIAAALAKYVGAWLFFFAPMAAYEIWILAALVADWSGIVPFLERDRAQANLEWIARNGPLVGLVGNVLGALHALVTLGTAGVASAGSRTAFLGQFGISLSSTAAGVSVALAAAVIGLLLVRR